MRKFNRIPFLCIATLGGLALAASPVLAAGSSFPPFDSKTFAGQIFWLAITFGALYVLMSKIALPRVGSILEQRQNTIASALSEASKAQKQAEEAVIAHEHALAKAKAEGQAIAQEARAKSAKQIDAQRKKSEAENADKLMQAETRITAMKNEAMGNVTAIAQEAVMAMIEQISGKPPLQKSVIDAVLAVNAAK